MFKNLVLYRIGPAWECPSVEMIDAAMQRLAFTACGPTQEQSSGWVPPRGHAGGAMVESVGGHLIMKLAQERRAVPAAAVRDELDAKCKAIEAERGRKPGRIEKQELKDEIILGLLPRAFSKRSAITLWLDPRQRVLAVDAGSMRSAEPALKQLVDVMAEIGRPIPLAPMATALAPAAAMSEWLTSKEAPASFTIDRNLELKKPGEERSVVKYARHTLDLDEIAQHIQEGKLPTQLALTWNDKASFVLTEALTIKRIELRGVEQAPKGEDGFDADVAIATGEISALVPDLVAALGGELEQAA